MNHTTRKMCHYVTKIPVKYGLGGILSLSMSKKRFNEIVCYVEEKIKKHALILKEIDQLKDENQAKLNELLWIAEKGPLNHSRPQSIMISVGRNSSK